MGTFRTWMEKAYKVLEDKERQLANLNKLQGNTDDIKSFVSDVMTHGADLKFLTMSGQKFVDLSKVSCLSGFEDWFEGRIYFGNSKTDVIGCYLIFPMCLHAVD